MKVFTVGLDEKPPIKEPSTPESVTVVPPPMITVEKKNRNYKGYLMCMLTVFFILLFAVILSELAYNRARDENYLRLRWAELKQRVAMGMGWGCDSCMNNMMNNQAMPIAQTIYRANRIEAAPMVASSVETSTSESTTPVVEPVKPIESTPSEPSQTSLDPRFEFLRQILTKIREQAEKAGIDGTMQVSLIRVDPMEEKQESAFMDGFGEIMPQMVSSPFVFAPLRRVFGPWPSEDYYNDNDETHQVPDFFSNRRADVMMPSMGVPPMSGSAIMGSPMMGPPPPPSPPVLPQVMLMGNPMSNKPDHILPLINQNRIMQNIPQVSVIPPQSSIPDMSAQQWRNPFVMGPPQMQQQQQQPQAPIINNQWQDGITANTLPRFDNGPWGAAPNRWQASLQRNNEWNVQRSNLLDNLDERMSQAVSNIPQDGGAPWWNHETQWGNNDIQQPQPQPSVFIGQTFNAMPMQSQQPMMPPPQQQQQQVPHQQPPQQQPMFFFPQQNFGNGNQAPNPPQFPVPDQSIEQQPQQLQQQLQPQVPQVPVIPQLLPVMQPQVVTQGNMNNQQQAVPQIQNAWPRTDAIVMAGGNLPQVPLRPIEESVNGGIPPPPEAPKVPSVAVDTMPFAHPQQQEKIGFQMPKFPGQPINEAARDEQMGVVNPIFFQVDEPRHLDDDGDITSD